jgi:thiamine-monophosphate kinase
VKVSEAGEFGLIHRLAELVQANRTVAPAWRNLVLGIGDDAAVWQAEPGLTLASTDCLIEGVHFTLETSGWHDLGWKALAVNLSDIAAMGGEPRYALVTLGLPGDTDLSDVEQFYLGMLELAQEVGTAIVGGDTSASPVVFINMAVTGQASKTLLTRSGAKPGDSVAVTGWLGAAAAGWQLIQQKKEITEAMSPLIQAFSRPRPRLDTGRRLVEAGVAAAIDISDGLVADLEHICAESRVGAVIQVDRVPVHPEVKRAFKQEALALALSGGEDYELLFAAPEAIIKDVQPGLDGPVTIIGEITAARPGQVNLVDEAGRPFSLTHKGWRHFDSDQS